MKNIKKYSYKVYGLKVDSYIEIPELLLREREEDLNDIVTIYFGQVTSEIREKVNKGEVRSIKKDSFWQFYERVGIIWIMQGKNVIVDPIENYNKELLKNTIISNTLGFLLLQRERIAIHGSTVVIDKGAVVITGACGAGKSTLTLELEKMGNKFLSDDIVAVDPNDNNSVELGFPYHKLCEDVVDKLNIERSALSSCKGAYETKYIVADKENFSFEKAPIKVIYEVEASAVEELEIIELHSTEKLQRLLRNIYRVDLISSSGGFSSTYFKEYVKLTKEIKYFKITRPRHKDTLQEIVNLINNTFDEAAKVKAAGNF